jgi:uncharacterized protein YbaP (TraB family)
MMQLGINSDLGVDLHMLKRAYSNGMKVYEIESASFQYGMMADFSEELQAYLLEQSIINYNNKEEAKVSYDILMDLWKEGNEEKLAEYINAPAEYKDDSEKALYEEYNNAMVINRNKTMTEYAQNALKDGKELFICVGAAHIVGEGAIADNLRQLGYTVEVITAN